MSPAVKLSGRIIKDHLPVLRDKYQTQKHWKEIGELRELAMAQRHKRNEQFSNQHCRPLQELHVGESIQIQNQDGKYLRRWTKTERVVEKRGNRQYQVQVDGSGQITLHNWWFLCKIYSVVNGPPHATPGTSNLSTNPVPPQKQTLVEPMDIKRNINVTTPTQPNEIEMQVVDTKDVVGSNTGEYIQPVCPLPLRQPSCRRKQASRNLSPRKRRKSYGFSDASKNDHVNSSRGQGWGGACIDGDWVICPYKAASNLELSASDWYKRKEAAIFFFITVWPRAKLADHFFPIFQFERRMRGDLIEILKIISGIIITSDIFLIFILKLEIYYHDRF